MEANPTSPGDGEPPAARRGPGGAARREAVDRFQRLAEQLRSGHGSDGDAPADRLEDLDRRIERLTEQLGAALLDGEDGRAEQLDATLDYLVARRACLAAEAAALIAARAPAERERRRALAAESERARRLRAAGAPAEPAPAADLGATPRAAGDAGQVRRALAGLEAEEARLAAWRRSLAERGDPFGVRAEVERQLAEAADRRAALSAGLERPAGAPGNAGAGNAAGTAAREGPGSAREGPALRPRTVLVVDDDPDIRGLLAAVLRGEGYAVELAADGLEALERLGSGPPALVLLDVMMPRLDGIGFARELGRLGLRPRVPVVLLSAGGRAREARDQVGAEGYLAKPFDLAALLETVARLAA